MPSPDPRAHGRRAAPRWGVAAGVSVVAHLLMLAALLWRPQPEPRHEPTTIEVTLTQASPRAPATPARPDAVPGRRAAPSATPPSSALAEVPALDLPVAVPPVDPRAGLREALRGSVGCGHAALARLSEAEARRCQERLARLGPPTGPAYGLDPRKRAIFEAEAKEREPFLARKPKNGCVPNLDEQEVGQGAGAVHDWKAGVNCAWSF